MVETPKITYEIKAPFDVESGIARNEFSVAEPVLQFNTVGNLT
jgi:hypothetical protein